MIVAFDCNCFRGVTKSFRAGTAELCWPEVEIKSGPRRSLDADIFFRRGKLTRVEN